MSGPSGRPESAHAEVQVVVIEQCLTNERHWTMAELSAHFDISGSTVLLILRNDLKMLKLCIRWVPYVLSEVQKWTRINWSVSNMKEIIC